MVLSEESHATILEKFKFEGRILDLGCGTAPFLRNISNSQDVYGLDLSLLSLTKEARDYLKPVNGDVEFLPFKGKSFNIVFTSFTFHHVLPIVEETVREIKRVLKPVGKVYVVEENLDSIFLKRQVKKPHPPFMERPVSIVELRQWFESAGFKASFHVEAHPFYVKRGIFLHGVRKTLTNVIAHLFPYVIVGEAVLEK